MSLLVLLVLHHIWIKSRVLRGTWSGTNMCSSGLRYCQFLVKVFSSSSSSGTQRGDQTDDHTGNDARKPDVTHQVSGLLSLLFSFLFFFCRFVVTYVLGPWKCSQMNDARYRRCLNHNIYYMRDIIAIYTIRYILKKTSCWSLSECTGFLVYISKAKTYFLQYQMGWGL